MRKLFGTDGIRGMANVYPMTTEVAMQVGKAVAYLFREGQKEQRRHRVLIGKDTRLSCYMIENAITAGVCSMGVDVLLVGPMPTPAISFLTGSMRADAGIVISASHNPFHDNGIKLFSRDGFKLPDHLEERIEELMESDTLLREQPTGKNVGKAFRIDDARGRYIVFLKNTFPRELALDGLKIVLDCANGATYGVAPLVFEELGADVMKIGVSPNGTNINDGCGALFPDALKQAVTTHNADMGVALDGDGDRLIVVDEKGRLVDGDHIMAICAKYMIDKRTLNYNTVVATVMSNMGLEIALEKMGGRLVRTDVGDRYVVEAMREKGYNLGGEQSGHLVFLDHITTGDGILAALQLLTVMQRTKRPLSELASIMETFPQTLVNVKVRERKQVQDIEGLPEMIRQFEEEFRGKGRILVRPSGTEPLLRVMVEGEDEKKIDNVAQELAGFISEKCK
jgi:phosphoglucosamine mutase